MKNVLIFNQSSELYGSDKALLELLENYPDGYNPIVVLAGEGPLKDILVSKGIRVIKAPVMKLTRKGMTPWGIAKLMGEFFTGYKIIRREIKSADISLVHSNSIAVFMGAFYAFFTRKKHLWHVHEIVEHPKMVAKAYPKVVSLLSDRLVFNSQATSQYFERWVKSVKNKSSVVYNGVRRLAPISGTHQITQIRRDEFNCDDGQVTIGLIGRISRLKGQLLLLEAFSELEKKHPNIRLIYIGSPPPGQDHYLENLINQIKSQNLSDKVSVLDFKPDLWPYYDALDIVVVPSTEPESFGLVAAEAMLSFRPVIGSRFGGLTEVIEDGKTGLLFEPGDALDLTAKLDMLVSDKALRENFGQEGKARTAQCFAPENYLHGMDNAYRRILGR